MSAKVTAIADLSQDLVDVSPEGAAEHALLRRLGLVDAPAEAMFDRMTELVREVLETPAAFVSVVQPYANRQYFKSMAGLSDQARQQRQTALSHSFCRLVRSSGAPLIVQDAHVDPRVMDNPSVTEGGVRAYIGCPIHLPNGQPIGALCAIDTVPRDWTASQLATLEWLATHVSQTISMISLTDALTASVRSGIESRSGASGFSPDTAPPLDKQAGNALAAEIWSGIERNEFVPYFQLQIDARTNRVAGAEVLARWKRADGDVVSPDEFLPMATRLGVVDRIERQVMARALIEAGKFHRRGIHIPELSFNMTFESLVDSEIVTTLKRVRQSGMNFAFEILESVMLEKKGPDLDFHIDRIRAAGFSIGLDDFGSGNASVMALLRISADFIKIDRSFVKLMERSRPHHESIRAIIAIAHECGARVTAEGVETVKQAQLLRALGCDVFQGYLFARPVDASEVGKALRALSAESGSSQMWSAAQSPPDGQGIAPRRGSH